jgi:hypothetical protein
MGINTQTNTGVESEPEGTHNMMDTTNKNDQGRKGNCNQPGNEEKER